MCFKEVGTLGRPGKRQPVARLLWTAGSKTLLSFLMKWGEGRRRDSASPADGGAATKEKEKEGHDITL